MFEDEFASVTGGYCAVVSSGTAALKVALKSLQLEKNRKKIIIQPFNFIAMAEVVYDMSLSIVWSKSDASLSMDPNWLESYLKENINEVGAVCVTSMLGSVPDLINLKKICDKHGIPLLLDACESFGARLLEKDLSYYATVACYSFDFGKTITAGEGGAIISSDSKIISYCRSYRDHGHALLPNLPRNLDSASCVGFNYRITELQAAILRVQLKKLPIILERYKERYSLLKSKLLSGGFPSDSIRRTIDESIELGDNLFLCNLDSNLNNRIINLLVENNHGIKNVPNALNWHDAYFWLHLDGGIRQDPNVIENHELLSKSVSINIDITRSIADYDKLASLICNLIFLE